jgi:hypothetical protein
MQLPMLYDFGSCILCTLTARLKSYMLSGEPQFIRKVKNMAVTLETITPPQSGPLNIEIKLTANIQVTPETARRRVGVFVGNEIADLLHGDTPDLVLREDGVYWRVPVVLSSRSMGRIGQVGVIDVDVETGDLNVSDQTISEIETRAQRFATAAAL